MFSLVSKMASAIRALLPASKARPLPSITTLDDRQRKDIGLPPEPPSRPSAWWDVPGFRP
ncbi:hypothetical protein [Falsirhodobacter sp. 1013]|uniref:hypothetical protein n=1 Tax=Falsirhodobacter sp. 1013 TaxID=3417566 RepID=UPI003EC133E1